jgi:hypothetical protein
MRAMILEHRRAASANASRRGAVRLAAICLLIAVTAVCLPGAVAAAGSRPGSVSFDSELLGSWAAAGDTLNVDPGAWTGDPSSIAAQWYRCDQSATNCAPIAGATSLAYTLVSADLGNTVFATVTATNGAGSGTAATYASGVVGAPTVVSEPAITGDANVDGTTLSVSHGSWTGAPTAYAYQWSSCEGFTLMCSPLPGATSSTYLVSVLALNGHYLTVDVTASNASGSADNAVHPPFAVGKAHTDVVSTGGISGVPVAVIYPTWTGDASRIGNVLVGDLGVWTNHPSSLSYHWYDCNPPGCASILGASSLTYTVQASDAGADVEFAVDAFNIAGQSIRYGFYGYLVNNTYTSNAGPAGAPEPLVPPELTGNAEGVGSVIQVTPVSWSAPQAPNITDSYQWVRCDAGAASCAAISGATSSSYTLTGADLGQTIYATVDGQNAWGTTSLVSTTVTPPIGAPVNADAPVIGGDISGSGKTLTVANGTWIGDPTMFQYQWYSCDSNGANCSAIGGATAASYQTTAGDVSKTLIAEVDATNADGMTSAFSDPSDLIGAPYATVAPLFSSTDTLEGGIPIAELSDTLSVSQGTWDGAPTSISYQWFRCNPSDPTTADFTSCIPIGGAVSASYLTAVADLGHTIYVEVDATNSIGTSSAFAFPHGSVGAPQPLLDDGSVSGTAQVGQTLTLVNGTSWTGVTPISWSYRWARCDSSGNNCVEIPGESASSYTLVVADQGWVIQGAVFGSNSWGANGWSLAYASALVAPAPIPTPAPAPAPAPGSGGGGGGGPLDLATSVSVSPTQAVPGGSAIFQIVVTDVTKTPATHLHVTVTLPSGAVVASTSTDRGQGCTATVTAGVLSCDLDYLAGSPTVGNIVIALTLPQAGQATLTATAAADQAETNTANNTGSTTVQVGSLPAPPPPASFTPSPVAPPVLKNANARALTAVTRGTTETVSGKLTTNEPLRLSMTVTRLHSTTRLALRKNSDLAGHTATATALALTRPLTHAGAYSFRAVLERRALRKGALYVVHLSARNANGRTTTLAIIFTA